MSLLKSFFFLCSRDRRPRKALLHNPRGWNRAFLVAFGLLFAAAVASGQNPPAKIEATQPASLGGTVSTADPASPAVLPAVTLRLSAVSPGATPFTTVTDEQGHYEFLDLLPGSYSITLDLQGFKGITKTILVTPGQRNVQDFAMELAEVTEKVEVKDTAAPVSTETAAAPSTTISNEELTSIPTAEEKVKELLPVTPGVIRTLDGKLVFKGSEEEQSLLLVNSARTTDPVTGSFAVPIPTPAVQSVTVYKTPYDASLGSFSGGLTSIETKPPDDRWTFRVTNIGLSVLGKNGHMVGLAAAIPSVYLSAPIIPHKLFFSEVFQYDMKKTTVEGLPWPYDISKRQGFNSFTTFEAILAPNHVLMITVNAFPLRQQHLDISALIPQPASNDLDQSGVAVGVNDKYQLKSGAIFGVVAQYMRFDSNAHGQGMENMVITPEGYGGNYFNWWTRRAKEFQLVPSFQFAKKHWHGDHEVRVGADVDIRSFYGLTGSQPIEIYRQDNSLAQQITFGPEISQTPLDSSVAEFVQDHWVINQHWAVDLGARLSTESSGWSAAFAPRVGFAYSPGTSGKTIIRGGAGVFYGVLPLLAANFSSNPTRTVTDFDVTGTPTGSPITYTSLYVGGLNPLVATNLLRGPNTTPRNITWNGQIEQELRRGLRLRAGYLDSHSVYLFEVQPFTAPSGEDSYIGLTNTGSSHYREFETTVNYSFRERDQLSASYIWSQSRGDLNSLSQVFVPFAAPVIRQNVYGILPSDVPNRFLAWGIFALPWKMTFSSLVDIHSGFPYSPIDVTQQYAGIPNGSRFPNFFSLDFKLYREFRVPFLKGKNGKGHHIRLGGYTLNVTDHGNFTTVYNNTASPNFGKFVGWLYRHEGTVIDFVD